MITRTKDQDKLGDNTWNEDNRTSEGDEREGIHFQYLDPNFDIPNPRCYNQEEIPGASILRSRVVQILRRRREHHLEGRVDPRSSLNIDLEDEDSIPLPLFTHLANGLAYTIGSALGCTPPSSEECLKSFLVPNKSGLTAGARAMAKHSHRSIVETRAPDEQVPSESIEQHEHNADMIASDIESSLISVAQDSPDIIGETSSPPGLPESKPRKHKQKKKQNTSATQDFGFWGPAPKGPVAFLNAQALVLFEKVTGRFASWRNLHWLPHHILVYEVRVKEGYGMRWSQDWGGYAKGPWQYVEQGNTMKTRETSADYIPPAWVFRGFVEPMMENGHELGWRHPIHVDESWTTQKSSTGTYITP